MQLLDINLVVPAEGQPRKTFHQDSLEELARSIKERGVLEPIVVRPRGSKYEIVMGERRYRASIIAGLAQVPAIVRELSDEEARADGLVENFQREDLNPVERSGAIKELLDLFDMEKTCSILGVSETTVRRHLEILELPDAIQQELVKESGEPGGGAFTEGHARLLRGLNDDLAAQMRLAKKIKEEKLSIEQATKVQEAILDLPEKKEAFLRVPLNVTEEILRHVRKPKEQRKAFKPQTAKEHLKNMERASSALGDILDDRVVDYLTAVQMNQLLSTTSEVCRALEEYTRMLRTSLQKSDHGFKEVYVHCPLCGRIELVGSMRCGVCWTVLRRCVDCGLYDQTYQRCSVTREYVYGSEAEAPDEHSKSYKCEDYKPKFEVKARAA